MYMHMMQHLFVVTEISCLAIDVYAYNSWLRNVEHVDRVRKVECMCQ